MRECKDYKRVFSVDVNEGVGYIFLVDKCGAGCMSENTPAGANELEYPRQRESKVPQKDFIINLAMEHILVVVVLIVVLTMKVCERFLVFDFG